MLALVMYRLRWTVLAILVQLQHRRAQRMREHLNEHVIVVGYGRMGQAVVRGVHGLAKDCVVVERDPTRRDDIRAAGAVDVIGDATSPTELHRARIERATALVAACDADGENLIVVLTARSMHPQLRTVSRVNEATWVERILQAGGDVAQSPYSGAPEHLMALVHDAAPATAPTADPARWQPGA